MVHRRDALRAEKILQDRILDRAANGNVTIMWDNTLEEVLGDDSGVTGIRVNNVKTDEKTEIDLAGVAAGPESAQTTHYSVVDSAGNAVAVTTTINGSFGSAAVARGAGFLLNNEMDDFSARPGTPNVYGLVGAEANAIAPNKRMLSSMSPKHTVSPLMVMKFTDRPRK